jgi:hypothetical protein
MTQVIDLDRVHRSQHEDAQGEHHPVVRGAGHAERVVIGVVDLAEAGEEEHERAREGHAMPPMTGGDPRAEQPRGRDRELVQGLELGEVQQVLPRHRSDRFGDLPPHPALSPDGGEG